MDRLRELARAATRGEWHESEVWPEVVAADNIVCRVTGAESNRGAQADRAFIAAANPAAILALLARLAAAERALRGMVAEYEHACTLLDQRPIGSQAYLDATRALGESHE